MTTPPTGTSKPGIPRALLLGGAVLAVGGVAAAAFFIMNKQGGDETGDSGPPPPTNIAQSRPDAAAGPAQPARPPAKTAAKKPAKAPAKTPPAVDPAVAAAKAQAAQALGVTRTGGIRLDTSFDNVPKSLGGTEARVYPPTPIPAPDNGGKIKPIVQGQLPSALRPDPFLSRLIIPVPRQYAYTLAVPIRLAAFPKPPVVKRRELDPDVQYGPLPYVPRRVAGFLEFGGVSAILETGQFGSGAIDIVQPGATVQSGIGGVPPLTVESISSTEMVLRAVDGRSTRVSLSGIPGGPNVPNAGGAPGGFGPGGPGGPGGVGPGGPSRGGRGGRGGGGGAAGVE